MKKKIPLIVLLAALVSCKKSNTADTNPPQQAAVKLMKQAFVQNNTTAENNFIYDSQDRISKVTYTDNNGNVNTSVSITYTNNQIQVDYGPVPDPNLKNVYTVDANKKPVQKIHIQTTKNGNSGVYIYDTTNYMYDSKGYLSSSVKITHDSSWSTLPNGQAVTVYQYNKYNYSYTYSNGNLTTASGSGPWMTRTYIGTNNPAQSKSGTSILAYTYSYSSQFANKLDFSNALILDELKTIYNSPYQLNSQLSQLPDKIDHTDTLKDSNGNTINSFTDSETASFQYNSTPYISSVLKNNTSFNLIYNK